MTFDYCAQGFGDFYAALQERQQRQRPPARCGPAGPNPGGGRCEICGELGEVCRVDDPDPRVPQFVCLNAEACAERFPDVVDAAPRAGGDAQ